MELQAHHIAKRFKSEWLFKNLDFQFKQAEHYALLGPNSSGKSTLLKILASLMEPTEGSVDYQENGSIPEQDRHRYLSYASPEMDLMLDYGLADLVTFHFKVKSCKLSIEEFYSVSGLVPFKNKAYRELSSGLQMKLKLALALFSDTPLLFLDEPCTNFDEANIQWYQEMVGTYCQNQLMVVASNQEKEIASCTHRLHLKDYKS